jgi:hypothetical protein
VFRKYFNELLNSELTVSQADYEGEEDIKESSENEELEPRVEIEMVIK